MHDILEIIEQPIADIAGKKGDAGIPGREIGDFLGEIISHARPSSLSEASRASASQVL